MKRIVARNVAATVTDQILCASQGPPKVVVSSPPDTGLLYSVDDIALLARVSKVAVVRLCLAGLMPEWREIDGRRYWDRAAAAAAVARLARAGSLLYTLRGRRKSA